MNKNYINSCLRWLANELVPYYKNKELPEELASKVNTFYRSVAGAIDWYNFDKEDLLRLGFLNWEDDEAGVWFIPNWLYPAIPEGLILKDKTGASFEFYRQTAPQETMYGCLTFGVTLPEESKEKLYE